MAEPVLPQATASNSAEAAGGTAGVTARPVRLTVPADKTYVALVRSAASHLGARLGLTIQELTDLRLAVDEACGLLLLPGEFQTTGAELHCRFDEYPDRLAVTVSAEAEESAPDVDGFGWSVLSALVDELRWSYQDGWAKVELVKRATAAER
ncbi:MAG TPA: ATP-binding protein [Actinomycetes bacterium]|nr:ATP-binding protein [Actinomycetes bacterium]